MYAPVGVDTVRLTQYFVIGWRVHFVEQITFHLQGGHPRVGSNSLVAAVSQQVDLHSKVSLSVVMFGSCAGCDSGRVVLRDRRRLRECETHYRQSMSDPHSVGGTLLAGEYFRLTGRLTHTGLLL